ncbi:acyltransferase [Halorientalis litorea]|jgi:acetyltransferase-like isoleucine patch superfamily enzyme|uniref:acyltransferase n=1 Tax=Halorientalis litorea TaxID=2931977 RepID=UPI001FF1A2C6|nr:acyltransferase [Halorientalis litorea]
MDKAEFLEWIDFEENRFHPLVWLNGDPDIGEGVYLGFFSVVNAKDSEIRIGDGCDIAPFVSLNCADSHRKCLGLTEEVDRSAIELEHNVFIGTQTVVKPGTTIGHHSVVGAGEVVSGDIPPYSLVVDGTVEEGYYETAVRDATE